jgi:hypothetical protein
MKVKRGHELTIIPFVNFVFRNFSYRFVVRTPTIEANSPIIETHLHRH